MSFIKKIFEWLKNLFWSKQIEMSVVGLQNAGKTTLINVMSSGAFLDNTIPTIGFNLREMKKGNVNMKIWDLGGQNKFRESWEKYCRSSDIIIFVVDSADFASIDLARMELKALLNCTPLKGITLLILANKNDLEGSLNAEEVINQMQLKLISDRHVTCFSISAKKITNIDTVINFLIKCPKKSK